MSSTQTPAGPNIDSILTETRSFPPPPEFKGAQIRNKEEYDKICARAAADPEGFWADIARELHWFKPWNKVLEWNAPFAKWFVGGKINLSYNCLDRHVATWRKNKAAIIWEGEPGEVAHAHLSAAAPRGVQVRQRAEDAGREDGRPRRHLHADGPELAIAMLACARIGAPHSVVFGGFSANALVRPHQRSASA